MDIFDQYLFEKLVSEYTRPDLTDDDYEELYIRFCNLDYLEEVKPYLLVMRFLGLGITAEADAALSELKQIMGNNTELTGLYYDLKLCANPQNTEVIVELRRSIEDGYCGRYLKDRSNIALVEKAAKEEKGLSAPMINNTVVDDKIYYRSMNFEGCGYSGLYFTSGDIDFLHAKVFIEPMNATRKITVLSQIFAGDEPFSKVFSDEIMLKPGDTWFTTTGWGNKNFNCYGNRVYRWVIEFDGNENDVHSQDFRFYNGKIKKYGVPINDIKLFASKSSGALETDIDRYSISFDGDTLEYIYFRLFINEPGSAIIVQRYLNIICLEDDSVFYDDYILQLLEPDWVSCWSGVGFNQKGKWKKGLYKYSLHLGLGPVYEGTFTVY